MRSRYQDLPTRRPLRIFASDPMAMGGTSARQVLVDVENEQVTPGPRGSRIQVVDYDGANDCFYPPVDLDDDAILMQSGLPPTESDPYFHQQMVYAVAMKVIENFERALGYRFRFRGDAPLRLYPHAFQGANAFFDSGQQAVLFGYFRADRTNPGPNLPGQTVFTCLSHDIIAHEMTHAVVHRLRPHFQEPTNRDVLAFHEGFSDIVAIFQHFTFREMLKEEIQRSAADIGTNETLASLASQFGWSTGQGGALRKALEKTPDPRLIQSTMEPHLRGSILVAAVFDAFYEVYRRRVADLLRLTGGEQRPGHLHPDLVKRLATEASRTAQSILTMCIRAFEYLPPVDINFGDYLRALVTADYELVPIDDIGQRAALIEAFRKRGIYPDNVTSLAEESLFWERSEAQLDDFPVSLLGHLDSLAGIVSSDVNKKVAVVLNRYAVKNAAALELDPRLPIRVEGFHSSFRVDLQGQLRTDVVAQFTQKDDGPKAELGGFPFRGGCTVVAESSGQVRYVIAKPITSGAVNGRFERQRGFVEECDRLDPHNAFHDEKAYSERIKRGMNLAALHRGLC